MKKKIENARALCIDLEGRLHRAFQHSLDFSPFGIGLESSPIPVYIIMVFYSVLGAPVHWDRASLDREHTDSERQWGSSESVARAMGALGLKLFL